MAKWWANIGSINASYSITFQGILPDQKEVVFHGADSIARVNVTSGLHQEDVHPEAKLKCVVQNYRPSEAKVIALGERDVIPPHRNIYELQLTYNFNVPKATEITPNLSLLTDVLYESEFISQLWLLYNSHKQVVDCGDAYANKWTMKVLKITDIFFEFSPFFLHIFRKRLTRMIMSSKLLSDMKREKFWTRCWIYP